MAKLFRKPVPAGEPIGESWEIVDRFGDESVVVNGDFAGASLRDLVDRYPEEVVGKGWEGSARFPVLVKIIDARELLSVQVHPPEAVAQRLGGEAKTEMWYILDANPGAELYLGLRRGVDRSRFERMLMAGCVADAIHKVAVRPGDSIFVPAGRVHALGGGIVVYEIQQNSDTTYRIYDWGRVGLDGRPRQLHIEESLESINFEDIEPSVVSPIPVEAFGKDAMLLADTPYFRVFEMQLREGEMVTFDKDFWLILGVVEGSLEVSAGGVSVLRQSGEVTLLPAVAVRSVGRAVSPTRFLAVVPGAVLHQHGV